MHAEDAFEKTRLHYVCHSQEGYQNRYLRVNSVRNQKINRMAE